MFFFLDFVPLHFALKCYLPSSFSPFCSLFSFCLAVMFSICFNGSFSERGKWFRPLACMAGLQLDTAPAAQKNRLTNACFRNFSVRVFVCVLHMCMDFCVCTDQTAPIFCTLFFLFSPFNSEFPQLSSCKDKSNQCVLFLNSGSSS